MFQFGVKVPKSDEEYDLRVPRDMAYIFSGAYVPLSCKLVEQASKRLEAWCHMACWLFEETNERSSVPCWNLFWILFLVWSCYRCWIETAGLVLKKSPSCWTGMNLLLQVRSQGDMNVMLKLNTGNILQYSDYLNTLWTANTLFGTRVRETWFPRLDFVQFFPHLYAHKCAFYLYRWNDKDFRQGLANG